MKRIWNEREKQIERVLANTAGMSGEVRGTPGASVPSVPALKLEKVAGQPEDVRADIFARRRTRRAVPPLSGTPRPHPELQAAL